MILKKYKIVNTNSFIIIFKRVYSNVFDVFSFCKKCKFEVLEDTTNLPCESIIFINHPNILSMFTRSRLVDVCYKYSKDMQKFTYKVESCAQEEI